MRNIDFFARWDEFWVSTRPTKSLFQLAGLLLVGAFAVNNWPGIKNRLNSMMAWAETSETAGVGVTEICFRPEELSHCPMACRPDSKPLLIVSCPNQDERSQGDAGLASAGVDVVSVGVLHVEEVPGELGSVGVFEDRQGWTLAPIEATGGCRGSPLGDFNRRQLPDEFRLMEFPPPHRILSFGQMMYQRGQVTPLRVDVQTLQMTYGGHSF